MKNPNFLPFSLSRHVRWSAKDQRTHLKREKTLWTNVLWKFSQKSLLCNQKDSLLYVIFQFPGLSFKWNSLNQLAGILKIKGAELYRLLRQSNIYSLYICFFIHSPSVSKLVFNYLISSQLEKTSKSFEGKSTCLCNRKKLIRSVYQYQFEISFQLSTPSENHLFLLDMKVPHENSFEEDLYERRKFSKLFFSFLTNLMKCQVFLSFLSGKWIKRKIWK